MPGSNVRCDALVVASLLFSSLLFMLPIDAQAGQHRSPTQGRGFYVTTVIGVENWGEADDIQPFPGGEFDSAGVNLELSFHTPARFVKSERLLWGITTGVMGHDSNIRGFFENQALQLSAVYLAPSLKLILSDLPTARIFLDAGAGFYAASIDEYDSYCYWYCDAIEYYDDNDFGGFVGLSADFDFGRRGGPLLNTGVKAHLVEFAAPLELGSTNSLGGPIFQFQIGVAWGG